VVGRGERRGGGGGGSGEAGNRQRYCRAPAS